MRVIIVGGGVGGCALALSLHAAGITDVEIHELADGPRELGVGINLLPHAVRELDELGIAHRVAEIAVATGELSYHNRFGQQIWVEPRGVAAGYRWPQFSVHRGLLLGVLMSETISRLGEPRVHFGSRIDPADVASIDADVVVACDGVHSSLRSLVVPDEANPPADGEASTRTQSEHPFRSNCRATGALRLVPFRLARCAAADHRLRRGPLLSDG